MNQVVEKVEFAGLNLVDLSEGIETAELGHEYEEDELTAEEFAEFLILNREVLGYKQCQMAEILGINKNSYNAFERAKRMPKNWEALLEQVRILVKAKQRTVRNGDEFKAYFSEDMKREVVELHGRGRNVVQIAIRLGVEESIVRKYLKSLDIAPVGYNPSWLSNTISAEDGEYVVDEYVDFDEDDIEDDEDDEEVVA